MAELQHYLCIKEVDAQPMNYGAFMTTVKTYTDIGKMDYFSPGYHVIYNLGTEDEYHSWSPKHIFEQGYVPKPREAAS